MTQLTPKPEGKFKVGDKIFSQHHLYPTHKTWYTVIRVTATQAIAQMDVNAKASIKVKIDYNGQRCMLIGNKDKWGQTNYYACEIVNETN